MSSPEHPESLLKAATCPASKTRGRKVEHVTLESLLRPEHLGLIGSSQWFLCPDPQCTVVYFDGGGARLDKSAMSVRVGLKEDQAPRPVCYCFEHTIEDIEADVAATGDSPIPASITEKCRQGLHRCEFTNPQGSCCLGNVRSVLKKAQAQPVTELDTSSDDCCAISKPTGGAQDATKVPPSTAGRFAALGAVASAVLSSACCWLPLLLLAFGASAAGVAGFFEKYRVVLLGVSAALLVLGFYLVYVRAPRCEPGDACAAPNATLTGLNKTLLWLAAAFVLAFGLFPNYVGALLSQDQSSQELAVDPDLEFTVSGMTCESCAVTLRTRLSQVPGVRSASVSYELRRASLLFESRDAPPPFALVKDAVTDLGYTLVKASSSPNQAD